MKRTIRKLKKANKFAVLVFVFTGLGYACSYLFFAKNVISLTGVESIFRFILLASLLAYFLFYVYIGFLKLLKKRYFILFILSILNVFLIIGFLFGTKFISFIYDKISNFNEKNSAIYTSYLITLKDTTLDSNSIIGMVDDEKSIEGNILAKEIIKENNLKQEIELFTEEDADVFLDMLYSLYNKEVDGIFISSNYVTLYSNEEGLGNISSETKVLYKYSKSFKVDNISNSNKNLEEPFSVLIMGVDSEYDELDANAAFNGDTLILATFNPHSLSATLLSIPRDTYVPIACRNNNYAKINSSAAYGTSCIVDTVENFTGIKIDYYAKINFKGVVDLVDAVGGVTVNVEAPDYSINHGFDCGGKVCEQDSSRRWGKYTIYIEPGTRLLNGEQALAYARCRGLYRDSDLARNRHQQDIILALANKMLEFDSYSKFKDVLDAISKNIAVNMSMNQILSSYKIFKSMLVKAMHKDQIVDIQKSKLETYNLPVYLPASGNVTAALGYYQSSLDAITKAMKINLELEEPEIIKTFNFSINEEYTQNIVGAGLKSGASDRVLQSFIGSKRITAEEYCSTNKITCSFKYVDENSSYYDSDIETDLISFQNPHAGTLMQGVSSVTFYINGASIEE